MGNELSEGCFRSKTLERGRTPLYDMGRVTPNSTQAKIHKYGQNFSSKGEEDKRKQSTSGGKFNEPIVRIHKKSCEQKQLNLKTKTGRPLAKSDILSNQQASDHLKVQKKKVYSYEIKAKTASFQGNNSSSTNDSRRQSTTDKNRLKKSDSLNTSQISLSQFNLPLETIVREKEESQQNQKNVKTNEKHKDRLNSKTNDRKSYRSHQGSNTARYKTLQKMSGKQFLHEKHKRRTQIFHEGKDQRGQERINDEYHRNQKKKNDRESQSRNKSESWKTENKKKTWAHSQHVNNFNNYGL